MIDPILQAQLEVEQENLPLLLEACVVHYLKVTRLRCSLSAVSANGFPEGYAKTFRIKPTKVKKEREHV